jgi:hypothetical protein
MSMERVPKRMLKGAGLLLALAVSGLPADAQVQGQFQDVLNNGFSNSDGLGESVALSGDTAVVGAPDESVIAFDDGAAYVYRRTGSSWSAPTQLLASDAGATDEFGEAVAIDGNLAVIGAPSWENPSGFSVGAAYVFLRAGATWAEEAQLRLPDASDSSFFGDAVAVQGGRVVVGAPSDSTSPEGGAAFLYERIGGVWTEVAELRASDFELGDAFGISVALDGDRVLVGARGTDVEGHPSAGAAYVFEQQAGRWVLTAKLVSPAPETAARLGQSVAIHGDTAVVGAPSQVGAGAGETGLVEVFVADGGGVWAHQATLQAHDAGAGDAFGDAVALQGDRLVVGAWRHDQPGPGSDQGAVSVFTRDGSIWSEDAELFPSSADPGAAWLGQAVALDGDTVLAGAPSVVPDSRALVFTLVFDPWADVGGGKAGTGGVAPELTASGPLTGGSENTLRLQGALAGGTTNLVVGASSLGLPFKGGVLVPSPDLLVLGLPVDAFGVHALPLTWPVGVPVGLPFWSQHWVQDPGASFNLSASNGLRGEAQ